MVAGWRYGPVAAGAVLAACSFTPDMPEQTAAKAPLAQGEFVSAKVAPVSDEEPKTAWWRLYDDPAVDRFVTQALANNNDLKAARANLARVRAALGESKGALLPSTEVSAGAQYGRDAPPLVSSPSEKEELTYSAGFDVSYELDFFGRVRNTVDAARADAIAAEASFNTVRISVAAETARAYADICAANEQIGVTRNTLDLQTRTVDLTRQLTEGGQGTRLDIVRATVNVENTRASLPQLLAARESARFRLATLTGQPPRALEEAASDCGQPPVAEKVIPAGDGAGLIARRPDVQQSESALRASAARVGVAVAELYPQISLGGNITSSALQIPSIGDDGSISFSVGPLISWTFPNQTTGRARIRQAEATMDEALAQFDQTVLSALEETESALQSYAAELQRQAALKAARDAAAESAEMARARYELGADDFITVLDAERTLAEADITLAQSRAATTQFQIAVFKALGGGWSVADEQPAPVPEKLASASTPAE